jgi:hypothetical protein
VWITKYALWNTAVSDDEWAMHAKCQEELSDDVTAYKQRQAASEKAMCTIFREVLTSEGVERTVARNGGFCDLRSRAVSSSNHRLSPHLERTYEGVRAACDERVDA